MKSSLLITALLGITTTACVGRAPVENRTCPCSDGFVCCNKTNLCLPEGVACTCPTGTHESGIGTCVLTGTCAAGYHDGGNGTCVALGTCSTGYRDGGGGTCVALDTCATGYHDGGDDTCLPAGQCIAGLHDDGAGKCVSTGCAHGYYANDKGRCTRLAGGLWRTLSAFPSELAAIRSSTDGSKLIMWPFMPAFLLSSDAGATWQQLMTEEGGSMGIFSATLSGDGQRVLVARAASCGAPGALYMTADFGLAWTQHTDQRTWTGLATTLDGAMVAATACNSSSKQEVLTSVDFGGTWSVTGTVVEGPPLVSQKGKWLAAVAPRESGVSLSTDVSTLIVSSDWGKTWAKRQTPPSAYGLQFVGPDQRLVAVNATSVLSSLDGGATWTEGAWPCKYSTLSASDDGHRLACTVYANGPATENGDFWVSSNAGETWVKRSNGSEANARLLALSGDGSKAFAQMSCESNESQTCLAVANLNE